MTDPDNLIAEARFEANDILLSLSTRPEDHAEQIASLTSMLKSIEWQVSSDQGSQWLAAELYARGARAPRGHQHVAPASDNGRCGGCRDLGPHRNVPGCDYYAPEPAPVTPSEPCGERRRNRYNQLEGCCRSEGHSGAHAWQRVEALRSAPSPDREKLEDPR